MAERIFHKDGQTAYAYTPAQVINLHADGWVEQSAPQPVVKPADLPAAPRIVEAANPANTAPTAEQSESPQIPEQPENEGHVS